VHLQSLALTNPHWAHVVGCGLFSFCVIHKEGLCPSSWDINRLMMIHFLHSARETIFSVFHGFYVRVLGLSRHRERNAGSAYNKRTRCRCKGGKKTFLYVLECVSQITINSDKELSKSSGKKSYNWYLKTIRFCETLR
jgi:hypothetical protein